MLRLKRGVNLSGLCPELVLAITGTCVPVFQLQGEDCTVTSGDDSRHSITSLHYAGRAVDIRSKNLTQIGKETALAQIKAALGRNFDVLLENHGKVNEHFHLEYQPRRPE